MTFPTFVAAATVSGYSGSSGTLDYPATVVTGELNLLIISSDGGGGSDVVEVDTAGWTELIGQSTSEVEGCSIHWQPGLAANGGGTVSCSQGSSEGITGSFIRITGWDGTTAPEISPRGTSSNDDWQAVSALNPSWNASTIDTIWIAGLTGVDGAVSVDAWPTGYDDNQSYDVFNTSSGFGRHGYATQENSIASLGSADVISALSANAGHMTWVMAIRGVSGVGPGSTLTAGTLSQMGVGL